MEPLLDIAMRRSLYVIEDACQAHGARYKERPAGSMGSIAAFSFYFSKNLGAYGEGGMVTTNDAELARRVRLLRNHGSEKRYNHETLGVNGRLDELQAAVLRIKLRRLNDWNGARALNAYCYNEALANLPIILPYRAPHNFHAYHLYVIRSSQRDSLKEALFENGIDTGIHYPVPIHLQKPYKDFGPGQGGLPITEKLSREILSLPMYAELTEEQIHRVARSVSQFYAVPTRAEVVGD
jgi:dTDP-4-amino-4,6-dideoxygalactose transaminase